ncbi:hypothetical protein ACRAWD_26480, partial [Caulobacter segnis]
TTHAEFPDPGTRLELRPQPPNLARYAYGLGAISTGDDQSAVLRIAQWRGEDRARFAEVCRSPRRRVSI